MGGIEIQESDTEIVLNQKGEWGSNLPPSQMTCVEGEIVDYAKDKGKKREQVGGHQIPQILEKMN